MVRESTDEATLAAINDSARAIVFLTVPWSCPERTARADFFKAIGRLVEIGLPINAFALGEESVLTQKWLQSVGVPEPFGGDYPQGWGSVLWLEFGVLVNFVGRGIDERAVGIIGVSKSLWAI